MTHQTRTDTQDSTNRNEVKARPIVLPFQDDVFEPSTNALNGYKIHDIYDVDFESDALGGGGYGTVYRGSHKFVPEMPVAIKKIDLQVQRGRRDPDRADLRRLIKGVKNQVDEISVLIKFRRQSYHMVHLYEYFMSTSQENMQITSLYMVTEFMPGGELFQCIVDRHKRKQPFTEGDVRNIFRVLLEAVDFMHTRQVVHRDLKPANLLLEIKDEPTSLKIADFGQSKQLKENQRLRTSCGTPGYRPPEMYMREEYDFCCDMFSAGVILFFLLAGYQPFSYDKPKIADKTIRCEYRTDRESWNRVSRNAKSLVKGLIVRADRRLDAQQALAHEWMKEDEQVDYLRSDLTENVKALVLNLKHEEPSVRPALPPIASSRLEPASSPSQTVSQPRPSSVPTPTGPRTSQRQGERQVNGDTQPMAPGELGRPQPPPPTPTPQPPQPVREEEAVSVVCCCFPVKQKLPTPPVPDSTAPPPAAHSTSTSQTVPEPIDSGVTVTRSQPFSTSLVLEDPNLVWLGSGTPPDGSEPLLAHVKRHIRGTEYTEKVARHYVKLIAELLARLHAVKVVHRNVTQNNILVSPGGQSMKLRDMHFAANMEPGEDCLSGYCGTPYRSTAPEVYTEFAYSDKVDVWSLGIISYILLSGCDAFPGLGSDPEARRLSGRVDFPFSDNVPSQAARDFVRRLLRPNPAERPSAQEALEHEWMHASDEDLDRLSLHCAHEILQDYFRQL